MVRPPQSTHRELWERLTGETPGATSELLLELRWIGWMGRCQPRADPGGGKCAPGPGGTDALGAQREGGEGGPEGAGVVRLGYWLTHPACTLFRVVVGNLHVF